METATSVQIVGRRYQPSWHGDSDTTWRMNRLSLDNSQPAGRERADSINEVIRDDHIMQIFLCLDATSITRLAQVCQEWAACVRESIVWQRVCQRLWRKRIGRHVKQYDNSFLEMYKQRPHIRLDGTYVQTNVYHTVGGYGLGEAPSGRVLTIHYYRYIQFLPKGKLKYALVNLDPPEDKPIDESSRHLNPGIWRLVDKDEIQMRVEKKGMNQSQYLRGYCYGTKPCAHNRVAITDFYGEEPGSDLPIRFPVPDAPFMFRKFR